MAAKAKPGDNCPKCGTKKASMTNYQYVRQGDLRTNQQCHGCPFTEHLHLSCAICGYTVSIPSADALGTVEDMSAASPGAQPPPIPVPTRPDA